MYEKEIGLIDDIFKQTLGFEEETIVAWQTLKSAVLAQQTKRRDIPSKGKGSYTRKNLNLKEDT